MPKLTISLDSFITKKKTTTGETAIAFSFSNLFLGFTKCKKTTNTGR